MKKIGLLINTNHYNKNNSISKMDVGYAIMGPEHLDSAEIISRLHYEKIKYVIIVKDKKDIELKHGNLEEVISEHVRKDDFHKKLIQSIENIKFELSQTLVEEIYVRKENSKKYFPIPKNDIIKSQEYIKKTKNHNYKRI